ncbi:MAG: hypothetical protein GXP37_12185 [Chloroflexi bacterium]|nr:hypothetical protein [Chloroflexota bacterium]
MPLAKNILYDGSAAPLPERLSLRAGPLTLEYENGDLRYIRLGEHEIVRRIYVAIRDHNWGTVQPVFSNLNIDIGEDAFRISYDAENEEGDIHFVWHGDIVGTSQGTITFSMDGEAHSTFRRNRIGFCVLHPMELAGTPCRVQHVDGSHDDAYFPTTIAPQKVVDGETKPVIPFNEMVAMTYPLGEGVEAEIRCVGDIFEMEDQRNWTDASYKTYCTPLRLPFPVEVKAGTRIRQVVIVTMKGDVPSTRGSTQKQGVSLVVGGEARPLPAIGLGVASHGQALSEREITRLKALHLSHLRVGLRLSEPGWVEKLRRVSAEARAIGVRLEVAIFLSHAAKEELMEIANWLREEQSSIKTWLIFHEHEKVTDSQWLRLARQHLADYDPTIPLGTGTNVFFTELNRTHPPITDLDLVCYSLNPQVHAFDNSSLVETLATQAATVASARTFIGDTPLAVTPVTLKMRFNPNATGPEPQPEPGQLPPQVDVRQMSLFGAGWTLGSLKVLMGSDVQSLTYYETTGWRGVMETETGSPLPQKFHSLPGTVFPMYHVFADVGEFADGQMLPAASSDRLKVEGLALTKNGRMRVLVANLTATEQDIHLSGLPAQVRVRVMDESNVIAAMQTPAAFRKQAAELTPTENNHLDLHLRPYALARIDG